MGIDRKAPFDPSFRDKADELIARTHPSRKIVEGPISRHYFDCPHCPGMANLDTHKCSECGASVVSIRWTEPDKELIISPELMMIQITNNVPRKGLYYRDS